MKSKILVIDDDRTILDGIRINLEREGFQVVTATNGENALGYFLSENPDLALIDVMLPDITGFELIEKFKKINPQVPCIFLTARNEIYDKISGFTLGAEDYITKPFDIRELILRIKVRIKPVSNTLATSITKFGDVEIRPEEYLVFKNSIELSFTRMEFELLHYLVCNKGVALKREQIFEHIWGNDADYSSRSVDMHISRIRHKIEDDPSQPQFIRTVFGIGYKFDTK